MEPLERLSWASLSVAGIHLDMCFLNEGRRSEFSPSGTARHHRDWPCDIAPCLDDEDPLTVAIYQRGQRVSMTLI